MNQLGLGWDWHHISSPNRNGKGHKKYIIQTTHKFKFKELRSIHSENHKNWTWLLVDVNAVNSFHNAYYYFITAANLLTNKG